MRKFLSIFLILAFAGTLRATTLSRVKTWTAREILTTSDLNAEFDNIITWAAGQISRVNIDTTERYRMDTLDIAYGLRFGTTAAATVGNVFWANGNLFISVTKDSAGIVAKTGTQTIAGKKTWTDSNYFTGGMFVSGEGTVTNIIFFHILPRVNDSLLAPSRNDQLTSKFYVDSMHNIMRAEAYDTAAAVVTTNNSLERPTYADSAARVVADTAGVLRTYTRAQIGDSLVEVRASAQDWAGDSAQVAITFAQEAIEDSLVEIRTFIQDVVEDSLVEIRTFIQDAIEDSLVEVRAEMRDNAADTFSTKIREVVGLIRGDTLTADVIIDVDTLYSSTGQTYLKVNLQLDPTPDTDSTINSNWTFIGTAGENLTYGKPVYLKSDGKYYYANADTTDAGAFELPAVALCAAKAGISSAATGLFMRMGYIRADGWNWTVGGIIYQDTTEGGLRQGPPTVTGHFGQVLGVAYSADVIDFKPDLTLVEK